MSDYYIQKDSTITMALRITGGARRVKEVIKDKAKVDLLQRRIMSDCRAVKAHEVRDFAAALEGCCELIERPNSFETLLCNCTAEQLMSVLSNLPAEARLTPRLRFWQNC